MTTAAKKSRTRNGANGQADPLAEARAYEEAIATEAAQIRGDATDLTPDLYLKLWPLLRRPIPEAFIVKTGVTKGKPYESTGVKSTQVLMNRMDNVLTPLWWWDEIVYLGDPSTAGERGKVAEIVVHVGSDRTCPLVSRSSPGGVNQASTLGNLFKGTRTNAAKRAFAAHGPGHEVYLGAVDADFDPDTSTAAAKAQERGQVPPPVDRIDADRAAELRDAFDRVGADAKKLKIKMQSLGVSATSVNQALASLTPAQADEIEAWLNAQADAEATA
jgi:hypothetical protein